MADFFPNPIELWTNEDWRDTVSFVAGENDDPYPLAPGTPIRMQVRETACSPYVELEMSTANGRLAITGDGDLAFVLDADVIRDRLGPRDCESRQFEADITAKIEGRELTLMRFGVLVHDGVTR